MAKRFIGFAYLSFAHDVAWHLVGQLAVPMQSSYVWYWQANWQMNCLNLLLRFFPL